MNILVNGKRQEVQNAQLSDLIAELGYTQKFIGVAVNGEVVPKAQYPKTALFDGDRIEVIAPLQGG